MKKILITLSLVVGIAVSTQAQHFSNTDGQGGGLFGRGLVADEMYYRPGYGQNSLLNDNGLPGIPNGHDLEGDQTAPLGSAVMLLSALGLAYLAGKRSKR